MRGLGTKRMSGWIAVALSALLAVVTAAIAVGVIRARLDSVSSGQTHLETQLAGGQSRLEVAIADLARAVALLTTAAAVNTTQHDDLSRRISAIELAIPSINEQIGILRTRSHVHANKLQELDPGFKQYRSEGEG